MDDNLSKGSRTEEVSRSRDRKILGGLIGRQKRRTKFACIELTPGPADYFVPSKTLRWGVSFTREKRRMCIENRTPGPAAYRPQVYARKSRVTLAKVVSGIKVG
eukprot:TRINITY_DN8684_c0_g1_i3.p5 TRINITY_DN8684_c0_g1~~TRINITY_DN8684_c0_g1_i3.p5  ORF type:complete len:104 (-),score=24.54 TRINITY_DN8684_c0_g1_i3:331-642(-)